MTRILALGDVHMGAHPQYADDRAGEQEAVLEQCVAFAADHEVDAVLLAGDLFHGPAVKSSLYRRVQRSFAQPLRDIGIPVVAVSGNGVHDSAANEGEDNALTVLHQAGAFDVYTRPVLHALSGCTVATLPWTPITRKVAAQDGGDRDDVNLEAALQLVAIARDLYEKAPADRPCVLLGHWSVSGAALPNGIPTDQLREPVLPLDEIIDIGFDAAIFAHIHRHQVLSEDPFVAYVGSPMALDFSEGGFDHGCLLVEVEA